LSDIPTEDNLSTKSSSIDLTSPIATDIESSKRISFVSDNLENFDEEKSTIFDHGEPELEPLEVPEISECSEAPSDVERIREMDIQRDLMSDIPAMRPSNPTEMNINIQEPLEISKPESPLSMHKGNYIGGASLDHYKNSRADRFGRIKQARIESRRNNSIWISFTNSRIAWSERTFRSDHCYMTFAT